MSPISGLLRSNICVVPGLNAYPYNQYLYDAEGRICVVKNLASGQYTEYVYDAAGTRVAKVNGEQNVGDSIYVGDMGTLSFMAGADAADYPDLVMPVAMMQLQQMSGMFD